MFEEFTKPSPADWQAQLEKELKGAALDSKDWTLADGTTSRAFHFPDKKNTAAPLVRPTADWQICEDITVGTDAKQSNRAALKALKGGAEGLVLQYTDKIEKEALNQVFEGVFMDYIGLHFEGAAIADNPSALLHALQYCADKRGIATTDLRASLAWQTHVEGRRSDYRFAAELIDYATTTFPKAKLFKIAAPQDDFSERPSDELFVLFQAADRHFEGLTKQGAKATDIAKSTVFHLDIGTSYFVEIAKLRAFRVLWLHFQKAWGISRQDVPLFVRFKASEYQEEIYTNMIRSTTMAMSAVIGGANQIVVLPHDEGHLDKNPYGADFSKRIARNVQHLLKSESYLNQIVDPAAGSYYIEDLTNQMAKKVWEGMG